MNLGVTRLSLGIEIFSDAVLESNGRAHLSGEIYKAWEQIRALDFPNTNIDLIAGMVGETTENWQDSVRRTIELAPDSVTIYRWSCRSNTVYSQDILGHKLETPVGRLAHQACLGRLRLRRVGPPPATASRARTRWCATRRKVNFQLSRQPVARQRYVSHGRGQLRAYLRRALSESAGME